MPAAAVCLMPSANAAVAEGTALPERLGPYRVLGELGRGGMGRAFLAVRDDGGSRCFVVKTLHAASCPSGRALFAAEAALGQRFAHRNLCPVVDVALEGTGANAPYFVMEHHAGGTVARLRKELGVPMGAELAARIVYGAVVGLEGARAVRDDDGAALEVVHCDIAPDNLFITDEGIVKVLDFGIAEVRRPQSGNGARPRAVLGKRRYLAPERLLGRPVDERTDVWGLGVLLHEVLAGKPLFPGELPAQCVLEGRPLPSLPASLPPTLVRLVERMLAPGLDDRPRLRDVRTTIAGLIPLTGGVADERALADARDEALAGARTQRHVRCDDDATEPVAVTEMTTTREVPFAADGLTTLLRDASPGGAP
jgi:serine/threonine-protein kinase